MVQVVLRSCLAMGSSSRQGLKPAVEISPEIKLECSCCLPTMEQVAVVGLELVMKEHRIESQRHCRERMVRVPRAGQLVVLGATRCRGSYRRINLAVDRWKPAGKMATARWLVKSWRLAMKHCHSHSFPRISPSLVKLCFTTTWDDLSINH